MAQDTFTFTHTKNALEAVESILSCKKCGVMMDVPVKYQACGHLLCRQCSEGQGNTCPSCQLPSRMSEIKVDNFTGNLIKAWRMIAEVVHYDSGKGGQIDEVPQLVGEEVDLPERSVTGVDEHGLTERVEKSRVTPRRNFVSTRSVADKPSSEGKQPRSKVGRGRGRPRRAVSCERKPDGGFNALSKGIGRKSSEFDGSSAPRSSAGPHVSATTTTPKKDLTKRNAKGETPLHVACIKNKVEQVKALLESGASPNTKDNAGWTPLHEVSSMGAVELVALLLAKGALPSVPGPENVTPLHDAVMNKNLEVVRLLVAHGADINARSSDGSTPLQSADDAVILAALREPQTRVVHHDTQLLDCPAAIPGEVVVLPCGLDSAQGARLQDFALQLDAKLCTSHTANFTHVVVPSNKDNVCPVTIATLTAILQARWIVSFEWVVESMEAQMLLPCSKFEIKGTIDYPTAGAPRNSRINMQLQRPGLFNGCHVYLVPQTGPYTAGDLHLTKVELAALASAGGATVLGREPNPEAIPPSQRTVPYHAPPDSPFARCSHYLVYQPGGRGEPRLKYNMVHIKSLPLEWLLACVQTFSFVKPASYS